MAVSASARLLSAESSDQVLVASLATSSEFSESAALKSVDESDALMILDELELLKTMEELDWLVKLAAKFLRLASSISFIFIM